MTYSPAWKHTLTTWKHYMETLELEPTYVRSMEQIKSQYRQLAKSKHPDRCEDCSPDDMVNLASAKDFLHKNHDVINSNFNDYLYYAVAEHFSHTEINVDGNERLLGAVFHDFGLDSF